MTEKKGAKLHQILAVEATVRRQFQKDLTKAHHGLQYPQMLAGEVRTYEPVDEEGERFPAEETLLQARVPRILKDTAKANTEVFDVIATRDYANTKAVADVVVDGEVLVEKAPSTYLLWLEKQLQDLHTFVSKLPTLPTDIEWEWDESTDAFKSKKPVRTTKTQKVPYSLVLLAPTKEHPGQAVEKSRDEVVGYWSKTRFCGALKAQDVREMKERVEKLYKAVKFARETANSIEVEDKKVGEGIMRYVFGDFVK